MIQGTIKRRTENIIPGMINNKKPNPHINFDNTNVMNIAKIDGRCVFLMI
jgi:hypothetical protein